MPQRVTKIDSSLAPARREGSEVSGRRTSSAPNSRPALLLPRPASEACVSGSQLASEIFQPMSRSPDRGAVSQVTRRGALSAAACAGMGVWVSGRTTNPAAAAGVTTAPPLRIVDTNISLFRWPFRRLPLDSTSELCLALRSLGVAVAIAGSFEGLFHRDLTGVNRRLSEECRGRAELLPVGSVNPAKPGWQADFAVCRGELGMRGIRLHPGVHGYALDHPDFRNLLEQALASGLFVQLVAAVEDRRTQPDSFRTADVDLQPLSAACRGLDGLRLQVLNARPSIGLAQKLCELPGLYFDTARLEGTDGVPRLVQSLPPGRVVFGSHTPFLIPEAALIRVHESGRLAEEQLRSVYESGLEVVCGNVH
ncbi:MAG: amidohydrolase family protein [Planctomycetota bacterium]